MDLHAAGFVLADDTAPATLRIVVPADPSVVRFPATSATFRGSDVSLVDPLTVLRDLDAAGPDAGEAVERLWSALPELLSW